MIAPATPSVLRSAAHPPYPEARFVTGFKKIIGPVVERVLAETLDACTGADLILYPTLGFVGYHIAERLGIAEAVIHFQPSRPTRAFPHPLMRHAFGANRLSFGVVDQLGWQLLRPFVNRSPRYQ